LVGEIDCVAAGEEEGGPAWAVVGGVEPVLGGVSGLLMSLGWWEEEGGTVPVWPLPAMKTSGYL
jgi:hypothetical protein